MNVDTLIHARWIIPVEPENTVFEDYALAIKNDKIVALLNLSLIHISEPTRPY